MSSCSLPSFRALHGQAVHVRRPVLDSMLVVHQLFDLGSQLLQGHFPMYKNRNDRVCSMGLWVFNEINLLNVKIIL